MRSLLWLVPLVLPLLGCDSSGGQIAAGAVAGGIGPAGADLKGPAGTQLEGLLVHIPPGALEQFVQVAVATEDGIFWTHEGSLIAVRPQ